MSKFLICCTFLSASSSGRSPHRPVTDKALHFLHRKHLFSTSCQSLQLHSPIRTYIHTLNRTHWCKTDFISKSHSSVSKQHFCCSMVLTKAIRGDTVSHSFFFLSANALVQPRTSFPGLSTSLSSFCHTSLWACLESGKQWKTLFRKRGAEKNKNNGFNTHS